VHLPELTLLTSAFGRFSGLLRLGMDAEQGEMAEYVPDLTAFDIIRQNLWDRLTDVSSTERSLKV
jgi:hypothetical protein